MVVNGWPHVSAMATDTTLFRRDMHISYWLRCLRSPLPTQYTPNDSSRMTLAFFVISALDLLGALFTRTTILERQEWIDWIYRCQHPNGGFRGFPATDFGERRNAENAVWDPANLAATYFALSTLCVLRDDLSRVDRKQCLRWLRSVQRPDGGFGELLGPDGTVEGGDDTRYGYCAMGVRWILRGNVSGEVEGEQDVDVERLVECIRKAETYDGGISEAPFHEAHAGLTYCAVGALSFVERVPTRTAVNPRLRHHVRKPGLSSVDSTIRWLLSRLTTFVDEPDDDSDNDSVSSVNAFAGDDTSGDNFTSSDTPFLKMQSLSEPEGEAEVDMPIPVDPQFESFSTQYTGLNGRTNKIADTCYAFWVGGALDILDNLYQFDFMPIRRYLLSKTQHRIGGFGKLPGDLPDIYHSYLGLAALALYGLDGEDDTSDDVADVATKGARNADKYIINGLDPTLCFSVRAKDWLEGLAWRRKIMDAAYG